MHAPSPLLFICAYPLNQSSDPCNISTCYKSATAKPSTTVTPTRLPVQSSSTPTGQSTTYAKDHAHASTAAGTGPGANATTAATTAHKGHGGTEPTVKSTGAAAHATVTTPKPINVSRVQYGTQKRRKGIGAWLDEEMYFKYMEFKFFFFLKIFL